jgi:hypothetical protein
VFAQASHLPATRADVTGGWLCSRAPSAWHSASWRTSRWLTRPDAAAKEWARFRPPAKHWCGCWREGSQRGGGGAAWNAISAAGRSRISPTRMTWDLAASASEVRGRAKTSSRVDLRRPLRESRLQSDLRDTRLFGPPPFARDVGLQHRRCSLSRTRRSVIRGTPLVSSAAAAPPAPRRQTEFLGKGTALPQQDADDSPLSIESETC